MYKAQLDFENKAYCLSGKEWFSLQEIIPLKNQQ